MRTVWDVNPHKQIKVWVYLKLGIIIEQCLLFDSIHSMPLFLLVFQINVFGISRCLASSFIASHQCKAVKLQCSVSACKCQVSLLCTEVLGETAVLSGHLCWLDCLGNFVHYCRSAFGYYCSSTPILKGSIGKKYNPHRNKGVIALLTVLHHILPNSSYYGLHSLNTSIEIILMQ